VHRNAIQLNIRQRYVAAKTLISGNDMLKMTVKWTFAPSLPFFQSDSGPLFRMSAIPNICCPKLTPTQTPNPNPKPKLNCDPNSGSSE